MITRLTLLVLAAFALLLTDTPEAAACSGWGVPPSMRQMVRQSDTIVLGETFRVHAYLKGSGAEYLLIALKSPREIEASQEIRPLSTARLSISDGCRRCFTTRIDTRV